MSSSRPYEQQIYDYFFIPQPEFNIKVLLIGVAVFIIGILIGDDAAIYGVLIGLILIAIPIIMYFNAKKKYDSRPSDSQMDQWLTKDIEGLIKKNSLDKLGLDETELVSESLFIPGPIYWGINGFDIADIARRLSNDKTHYKYSVYNLQIFHLTNSYLAHYSCYYNWLRNTYVNEATNEFFYKDVVSVKTLTSSSAYTLRNNQQLVNSQQFQLKLSGDEVSVIINSNELKISSVMDSKIDKVVQSIRAILREKKS